MTNELYKFTFTITITININDSNGNSIWTIEVFGMNHYAAFYKLDSVGIATLLLYCLPCLQIVY